MTFMLVLFLFLILLPVSEAQPATCSDNFDGPQLQSAWEFVDFTGDDDAAAEVTGGELMLQARGLDVYHDRNFFAGIVRRDILGDYDISVKIITQDAVHPWSQTGIIAVNNIDDLSAGGYSFISISSENGARYFYDADGTVGETNQNIIGTPDVTLPVWIRLQKAEGRMFSWYKTDSSGDWQDIHMEAEPQEQGENSHIALYTFSHEPEITGAVTMDDFTCLHGEFPVSIRKPAVYPREDQEKAMQPFFNLLGQRIDLKRDRIVHSVGIQESELKTIEGPR